MHRSLLGIFNLIGGNILSLLIGEDAWVESNTSLYVRPIIGGVIFGMVIGGLIGA